MIWGADLLALLQQRLKPDSVAADDCSWKLLEKTRNGESIRAPEGAVVGGWSNDRQGAQHAIHPIYIARLRFDGVWHVAGLHGEGTAPGVGHAVYTLACKGKFMTCEIGQVLIANRDQVIVLLDTSVCVQVTKQTRQSV